MKKSILLLTFFVTFNCLYSQSNKYIAEYQSNSIHVALRDNQGKELTKVLFGNDVSVSYDRFYKIFEIKFQNREGGIDTMKLYPFGEGEMGGTKFLIMKDNLENTYNVYGNIEKYGTLVIFFNNKTKEGNTTFLTIQGAKKVHSKKTNQSDIAFNKVSRSN